MEGWGRTDVVRGELARFLGAHVDEVAYFQTTASALSQAAFGLPLLPGDEVLTWDQEYPSNFYPWREACSRAGAELIQAPSQNWETPVSALLERVTPRTKAIAVSWVQYQTGAVTDLSALSEALRGRDIWLIADVIQGVGVRPFHFHQSGFDIVCGGSHKWLCSSYGAGFMLVKKERFADLLPIEVGAMTYGTPETPKSMSIQPRSTASRYEPGSKAMVEVLALGKTLELFEQVGIEKIFAEACRLADLLRQGLRDLGYQLHCTSGPIVNFSSRELSDLESVEKKLSIGGVSFARRGPGVRLSIHAFNRESEVARVISLLSPS